MRSSCPSAPAACHTSASASSDFANAAGPELDVVCNVAPLDLEADLIVQVAHRGERAIIEVAAENERSHEVHQFASTLARDNTAFDPRVTLPLATLRDEIVLEH